MGRYLSPRYPIGVFYMEQVDFPINTDSYRYNTSMPIPNIYKDFFLSNLKYSRKKDYSNDEYQLRVIYRCEGVGAEAPLKKKRGITQLR